MIQSFREIRSSITADTALRLGKFFSTGPEFWLNLQKAYELDMARQKNDPRLYRIQPYRAMEDFQPVTGCNLIQAVIKK